ncbi:MAG: cytochrome c oxidase subunit 3, partial [Terriglobales bacterium]
LKRAVWLAMAAMTSFFLALTYAYLERHGLAGGWLSPPLIRILSANTAMLGASSLALWRARQFLGCRQPNPTLRWLVAALLLGLGFLAGQAWAWHTLLEAGVYVASHPNSGFFYLVTAAHAAHLIVALGLLAAVLAQAWRGRLDAERPLLMDVTAIFWHCLDITWIYLYLVLLLYR